MPMDKKTYRIKDIVIDVKKLIKAKKHNCETAALQFDTFDTIPTKIKEEKQGRRKKEANPKKFKKKIRIDLPEISMRSVSERKKVKIKSILSTSAELMSSHADSFTGRNEDEPISSLLTCQQADSSTPRVSKMTSIFKSLNLSNKFANKLKLEDIKERIFARANCPFRNKNIRKSLDLSWILPTISNKGLNKSVIQVSFRKLNDTMCQNTRETRADRISHSTSVPK
ncbi:unnamed protein product [Moneuplotes crassus]|uniref:Uncharacterized protein n=1 Tax=Euplotes crassus TaxID=5936 RepID=A0AAD1UDH5_EUPCR|nr:unnamed protein product [Moneuplotes crassus]